MVKFMIRLTTIFTVCCILICFCWGSFSSASAGKGEIHIGFEGQIMSAELRDVSLREILKKLKREKGIWFEGDESLLEEKVSIWFKDLPLQEGLRRILSCINHILVFDQDKRLVGVFILGRKSPGRSVARNAPILTEKALPSQPEEGATVNRNPFEIFPDASSPANAKTKTRNTMFGKGFSPPEDQKTEMSDTPFTQLFPSSKNPFAESMPPSSGNPFAENIFPAPENPFDENILPAPEDPFGRSPYPQKGEGL